MIRRAAFVLAAIAAGLVWVSFRQANARLAPPPAVSFVTHIRPSAAPRNVEVWRVEQRLTFEEYSNGLRIDNSYCVAHRRRSYLAFPAGRAAQSAQSAPVAQTEPAGIVFHSTESQLAPFEAGQTQALKKIGESLLEYVRRRRSYHFLIDRFGRVYRLVAETDAANHAGYSVWGDERWLYVNLNESFLGVAFESQTGGNEGEAKMTAAQVRSGAMLTEMLRSHYQIAAADCVTHAQVSVNPSNMRIGYHVDWAAGFPFAEMGLPNGYSTPPPSIWALGFEADSAFENVAGPDLLAGIAGAGRLLGRDAGAAHLSASAYRRRLQQEYRRRLAAVRGFGASGETDP